LLLYDLIMEPETVAEHCVGKTWQSKAKHPEKLLAQVAERVLLETGGKNRTKALQSRGRAAYSSVAYQSVSA
jgi:hypothetical protein